MKFYKGSPCENCTHNAHCIRSVKLTPVYEYEEDTRFQSCNRWLKWFRKTWPKVVKKLKEGADK